MATTAKLDARRAPVPVGDLPAGLTEARLRQHVIAPPHARDVVIEEVDPRREHMLLVAPAPPPPAGAKADFGTMGLAIHTALKNVVTGYTLQVRLNGTPVYGLIWNWARTPADGGKGWTADARMHIASVSKLMTAIGMVKALDAKSISYDAPIAPFLPAYWTKGPKVDAITFRHLMTHSSGFSGSQATDFTTMKNRVAAGVAAVPGNTGYQNMNFGLCRILIPIVAGMMSRDATFPIAQDQIWDALTIQHYRNHIQANVFTPAGVSNVGFATVAGGALAYRFPHSGLKGWDSGDLQTVSGAAGWRLSLNELLSVMDHFRRKGTIMSSQKAQQLLANGFGIDQIQGTPAGNTYNKNGGWGTGAGETEQCVAFFLPDGLELAAFVNSPIGTSTPAGSLRGLVQSAYVASLSAPTS
jgi:CubicO group peptidase (beta-lactamase class C family)